MKVFPDHKQIHRESKLLANKIMQKYPDYTTRFKGIVGVARGGLIIATYISHYLNIKNVRAMSLSSYSDDNIARDIRINHIFRDSKQWIIIDELVDSGTTLEKIREYHPNSVYAVLHAKPNGKHVVDIYAKEMRQDQWIVYPWEVDNTIDYEWIWNWFGDRGVFFSPLGSCGNPLQGNPEDMRKCFSILDWRDRMIFCQVDREASKGRLSDSMDCLALGYPGSLLAIDTSNGSDVIEITCFVKIEWYHHNKNHPLVADHIRYNYCKGEGELWVDIC